MKTSDRYSIGLLKSNQSIKLLLAVALNDRLEAEIPIIFKTIKGGHIETAP